MMMPEVSLRKAHAIPQFSMSGVIDCLQANHSLHKNLAAGAEKF
jgi:hypothetical protein